MGYTPDCDGDRGNLVVWDQSRQRARTLEAQEVFALACVAELSQLVWTGDLTYDGGGRALTKAAVVVNDATSLRIDRIAAAFGASVFRAETGEANVVGLARKIRGAGSLVRILGEGSAGGNITHPQAVRDPLNTVLALAKLLTIRSRDATPGLFELWCTFSNQKALYHDDFDLADVITSLPPFTTTAAYEEAALLKVKTPDHSVLKNRYQQIFVREWDKRKEEFVSRYGIYTWEAAAYNGTEEKRGIDRFGDAGKGGLKIYFSGRDGRRMASVWMRGSATEPVFRIMADIEGRDKQAEQNLIEWQRRMVTEADAG
jgi:phosphoglucomutase